MINIIPLSYLENRWSVEQRNFETNLQSLVDYIIKLGINNVPSIKKLYVNVNVHSVSVGKIRLLNNKYRNKNKATNVLSFSTDLIPKDVAMNVPRDLGDIFVCIPIIKSEAKKIKKDFKDHLCHLLIHGLLHLIGFDHENDTDADKMEKKEAAILEIIGIQNPYKIYDDN